MFELDQVRLRVAGKTDPKKKAMLGQFLTPSRIARFMAEMFKPTSFKDGSLLDPGAGLGVLSVAFIERFLSGALHLDNLSVAAFEIDEAILPELESQLNRYKHHENLSYEIFNKDFINETVRRITRSSLPSFTHAILNPPYKKISSDSMYRHQLRLAGIETVNLYSAFVALALSLLKPGGQLVAIIPRSFCNGPYYKPFREYLLHYSIIKHIHLFHSRDSAFKDEDVLQENVIILLERNGPQEEVVISTSTDDSFSDIVFNTFPMERIVSSEDSEHFINIPMASNIPSLGNPLEIKHSLTDLGLSVSTGPVVDFRLKEYLLSMPEPFSVPLLYPGHLNNQMTTWPIEGFKKANAILRNDVTEKWLFPNGYYCLVKRFSSKEEHHRIVATAITPESFQSDVLGFENHLNVIHHNKQGLPANVAFGLAAYLNSSAVDDYFRLFSGHTQVNATDLRRLKFPSFETIQCLGDKFLQNSSSIKSVNQP